MKVKTKVLASCVVRVTEAQDLNIQRICVRGGVFFYYLKQPTSAQTGICFMQNFAERKPKLQVRYY